MDQQGDAERQHAGRRRALAWIAVVATVLATVAGVAVLAAGSGTAAPGALAAARQPAPGLHDRSPARPHRPPASLLESQLALPPTLFAAAPGTPVMGGADQSDPFLTAADGRYLLLTSGGAGATAMNVPVATSTDFTHWADPVDALPVVPGWVQRGFTWAPDLHRFGSRYVLYFTAMVRDFSPQTECIGSAVSLTPTGPFWPQPTAIICQLDQGGSIDPRVFVDGDGTPWMVWKSDQNIGGADTPTKMWSEQLAPDGLTLLGSPSFLMSPDRPWQGTIVEAPDLFQVGNEYWMVYSANWYNHPEYAIGAARCAGPAGPCADVSPGPLLASNLQGEGPGEASVFHDGAGLWMLYSPWRSLAPHPDIPPRPVYITRLGIGPSGPYLAQGPLPGPTELLAQPIWSPTP